jgi:diguanylate cyclase (GGDEF)-like protein
MSDEFGAGRLIECQLSQAATAEGALDLERLKALVVDAYEAYERDRRRTDRWIAQMMEENRLLTEKLQSSLAAAQRARARFEAAQESLLTGLSMFDADNRLVVANRRFREMYNLEPEAASLGVPLSALLDGQSARIVFGEANKMAIRRLARIAAKGRTIARALKLPSGAVIEVTLSPVQGGGWLAMHRDVTAQRAAQARIAHMARHDALTDLGNRTLFQERLTQALARLNKSCGLAVLALDLDGFKSVNDTLGHPAGDKLLQEIARRLSVRVSSPDVVARLGGDEFAIVQSDKAQPEAAMKLASVLIAAVGEPCAIDSQTVQVGVSIGVAMAPQDARDADTLLRKADIALFRAKDEGRNIACRFRPEMDQRLRERRALEIEIREAIAREEFVVHYQPMLSFERNRIASFEALARWRHPRRGLLPPAEFLPLAEETGLIEPIGEYVLRSACREAVHWPNDISVAVNVSPAQFKSKALALTILAALNAADLAPQRLDLEITETALREDTEAVLHTLAQLRAIGVRIAMDDFGAGYSSLSYLRRFPFDRIKIDRSFIREMPKSAESGAIVRAIIGLGRNLGVATVAEGVESSELLGVVRDEGCAEAQGFVLSRAMPPDEVRAFLDRYPRADQTGAA